RYLVDKAMSLESRPLVSVIMPAHNRAQTIEQAIQSVLDQIYPHFELIIIDDGSTDGTRGVLESFRDDRMIVLANEICGGVSRARNLGLRRATGSIIAYLDSDNAWDPRYLAAS